MPLYLSFDFNRNPMACNVIQWDGHSKIDVIEIIKILIHLQQVCEVIKMKYETTTHTILHCAVIVGHKSIGNGARTRRKQSL